MTPAPSNFPSTDASSSHPPLSCRALGTESGWSGAFWALFRGPRPLARTPCLGLGSWAQGAERREDQREQRWQGVGSDASCGGRHVPAMCLGSSLGGMPCLFLPATAILPRLLCGPLGAPHPHTGTPSPMCPNPGSGSVQLCDIAQVTGLCV